MFPDPLFVTCLMDANVELRNAPMPYAISYAGRIISGMDTIYGFTWSAFYAISRASNGQYSSSRR